MRIYLWSLGALSEKTLHTLAKAAVQVAPRGPMCALASMKEGHFHQSLSKMLRLGRNDLPLPTLADLPLRNEKTKPAQLVEGSTYPLLFPHELIACCLRITKQSSKGSLSDRLLYRNSGLMWPTLTPDGCSSIAKDRKLEKYCGSFTVAWRLGACSEATRTWP